jgi:SAM-dependent methyltransferase
MSEAEPRGVGASWLPSNDAAYVRAQYEKEDNLAARASVWVDDGTHPTDIAIAAIKLERPTRILEVGCGQGHLAEVLARKTGADVIATDHSPRMVELAAARGLTAEVADVQALPYDDESFDCVVAAWMLYHVPDLDLAVSELARVTRPGGLLAAITNGGGHLQELWERVDRPLIPHSFSSETGVSHLQPDFKSVERHDFTPRANFADRATAVRYLSSVSDGRELVQRLPLEFEPFEAHGEVTVFLARR